MTTGALADTLVQEFGLPGCPARFRMSRDLVKDMQATEDSLVVEIVELTKAEDGLMVLHVQKIEGRL